MSYNPWILYQSVRTVVTLCKHIQRKKRNLEWKTDCNWKNNLSRKEGKNKSSGSALKQIKWPTQNWKSNTHTHTHNLRWYAALHKSCSFETFVGNSARNIIYILLSEDKSKISDDPGAHSVIGYLGNYWKTKEDVNIISVKFCLCLPVWLLDLRRSQRAAWVVAPNRRTSARNRYDRSSNRRVRNTALSIRHRPAPRRTDTLANTPIPVRPSLSFPLMNATNGLIK